MKIFKLFWKVFLIILIFEVGVQVGKWDTINKQTLHKDIVHKVKTLIKG